MSKHRRTRVSKTTTSRSKRSKRSFSEHFSLNPTQTRDLRLHVQSPSSLFSLPQDFSGKASDFLKQLITVSFIEVLIPVYCRRHLQISSSYIDFWIFIAVWLSMGLVGLSNIHKHFYHGRFWANYVASTFMARYRFKAILGAMKGSVGQLSNILQHNLRKIYSPSIKGSIDETILAYTGKSPLEIYMKAKPHPNGVKLYTYVDENGVLLSFFVHKKGESQTIYQIFKRILFHFKDRQLKIYADRWFGSKNAMEYCLKHRIKFVLAMQSGRGKKLWNNMLPHMMRDGYAIWLYDKGKNV